LRSLPRLIGMTRYRHVGLVLALPLLALLLGCGSQRPQAAVVSPTAPDSSQDETRLGCGGEPPGWPVAAMDGGIDSRYDADELATALETLVQDAGIDAPLALQDVDLATAEWFVLAESETSVTIATGEWDERGPGEDGQVVGLERRGDGWRAAGWSDCASLAPVIETGLQWVEIHAPGDLDTSSTELAVSVNEVACTSGRDPRPFLREPRVVEDRESVTVYWTSEAPQGVGTCVGNRPVSQMLHLDEPLGDRVLLDGSRWPARPIANRR
jgi:hypothetical protein